MGALHYADGIRQNEWVAHTKRQRCRILRKFSFRPSFSLSLSPSPLLSFLPLSLLPFSRSSSSTLGAYSIRERRRIPRSPPASRSIERRIFSKRDNFVLRQTASHNDDVPAGLLPGLVPGPGRNTNQLKEQWSLQIPLSYARFYAECTHKARFFVYVPDYSFFLK